MVYLPSTLTDLSRYLGRLSEEDVIKYARDLGVLQTEALCYECRAYTELLLPILGKNQKGEPKLQHTHTACQDKSCRKLRRGRPDIFYKRGSLCDKHCKTKIQTLLMIIFCYCQMKNPLEVTGDVSIGGGEGEGEGDESEGGGEEGVGETLVADVFQNLRKACQWYHHKYQRCVHVVCVCGVCMCAYVCIVACHTHTHAHTYHTHARTFIRTCHTHIHTPHTTHTPHTHHTCRKKVGGVVSGPDDPLFDFSIELPAPGGGGDGLHRLLAEFDERTSCVCVCVCVCVVCVCECCVDWHVSCGIDACVCVCVCVCAQCVFR